MLHYINIQIQLFFFRNQNKTGRKQKELEIFENTMGKGYKQQQSPEHNQVTFGMRSMGGSYSSKTGASSQIINPMNHGPRLAEVARALMAAKAAGELPQASNKDLELQESYR